MKKPFFTLVLGCALSALHAQHFSLIKDINPGAASSNICYLTRLDNQVFFGANNGTNGMELWKSDGTTAGTVLVKDINPGAGSSSIGYITAVGTHVYFVANNGSNGVELWKSDGTAEGTVMVKDIRSGSASSYPNGLAALGSQLLFSATDGANGAELWKTDGTAAGTVMLKDIYPGGSSFPQELVNVNGIIFFSAENASNGRELWKTDGTAAGTVMVKDIYPGSGGSYPSSLVAVGSTLFFTATNGVNGTELWKSDGTAAGTVMVKDIWSGGQESYPYNLRNVAGTLYFSADNGANGFELWKSDGTAAGTVLVKDIWPGAPSGTSGNFASIVNQLVFTGNDGINGDQNWQSDGSTAGTQMSRITTDPGTGTIREVQETDTRIYASIQEESMGRELYALSFSPVLPLKFLKFEGKLQQEKVLLNWKTAEEQNTDNFVIERSTNGRDFVAVGTVNAANTAGTHNYSFIDKEAFGIGAPVVYYRLRQNDLFGRYDYSSVIVVNFKAVADVHVFPVPATDRVWVSGNFRAQKVSYQVFDYSGKQIMQNSGTAVNAGRVEVPVASLATGVYYLLVHDGFTEQRLRIVKQ